MTATFETIQPLSHNGVEPNSTPSTSPRERFAHFIDERAGPIGRVVGSEKEPAGAHAFAIWGADDATTLDVGHIVVTFSEEAAVIGVISLWTPLTNERIYERWFTLPNLFFLSPVPLLAALAAWWCWRGLEARHEVQPFVSAIALFLLGFLGLLVSNVPYLVPPSLTVWDTAASPSSQEFLLLGVLVLLPVILGYTVFVYWTFRGKTRHGEGYHHH